MKPNFIALILFFYLTLLVSCTLNFIKHDPKQAISQAMTFSKHAFATQDYPKAYQMLRKDVSPDFSVEKFREVVIEMHPSGEFPKAIFPLEYQQLPGQKQIDVYLSGESPNEKHYYLIVMVGTEESGYTVSEMYRKDEPYANAESRTKIEKK